MDFTPAMQRCAERQPERRHPAGCPCVTCRQKGIVVAAKALALPLIVSSPTRLDFFMEFEPPTVTAQHKGARVVIPRDPAQKPFIHWYTKPEIEAAEKLLADQLAPFVPAQPFQGPLRLVAEWTFPWRTAEPKRNRGAGWMWKDTAPDVDNCQKALSDVMQRVGFFGDDSLVAELLVSKRWGDRPGIRITLEGLEQP